MTRSDNLTREQRKFAMTQVKSRNTSPEIRMRKLLLKLGYRGYRLHRSELPGKPDIVWIGRKIAIFVNGCFWHGHDCHRGGRMPKTRLEYWSLKIQRNKSRDAENCAKLLSNSWRVLTVWECELSNEDLLSKKVQNFMSSKN